MKWNEPSMALMGVVEKWTEEEEELFQSFQQSWPPPALAAESWPREDAADAADVVVKAIFFNPLLSSDSVDSSCSGEAGLNPIQSESKLNQVLIQSTPAWANIFDRVKLDRSNLRQTITLAPSSPRFRRNGVWFDPGPAIPSDSTNEAPPKPPHTTLTTPAPPTTTTGSETNRKITKWKQIQVINKSNKMRKKIFLSLF